MNIETQTNLLLDQVNRSGLSDWSGSTDGVKNGTDFGAIFGEAVAQFNQTQATAEKAVQSLVMGEDVELHDIMIQTTEAQLSLELAVQVRNKCLEAYNDLKNMQF